MPESVQMVTVVWVEHQPAAYTNRSIGVQPLIEKCLVPLRVSFQKARGEFYDYGILLGVSGLPYEGHVRVSFRRECEPAVCSFPMPILRLDSD